MFFKFTLNRKFSVFDRKTADKNSKTNPVKTYDMDAWNSQIMRHI